MDKLWKFIGCCGCLIYMNNVGILGIGSLIFVVCCLYYGILISGCFILGRSWGICV